MSKCLRRGLLLLLVFSMVFPLSARAAVKFTDIDNHWAKSSILSLQNSGYIKGYADNTFRPDQPMTRSGFVTVLVNCLGGTKAEDASGASFTDIKGHWSQASVNRAVKLGIIIAAEYPNGFAPDNPIKRSEAAAMLVRAAGLKPDTTGNLSFKDADDINKSLYKGYIKKAVDTGLISGYSDETFRPFTSLTRSQTCALIVRFLEKTGKATPAQNTNASAADKPSDLPDISEVIKTYSFYEGGTLLHNGTSDVKIYAGSSLIDFNEIAGANPAMFLWNSNSYNFIGSRVRIDNVEYTVTETVWRGSTLYFEVYLRRI